MENERKMKQVVDLKNRKPTAFQTFLNSFIKTDAKTLRDLKNELAALEKKKASNDSKKRQTQSEINSANNRIQSITGQIANRENNITRLTGEIATLEAKAIEKEAEIKGIQKYGTIRIRERRANEQSSL